MPVITGPNLNNSLTVQTLVNEMRAYPEFIPVLGTSGYSQYPALNIANDLMQRILAETMDWKWNRAYIPAILTVALQQDYVTQCDDMGWLEMAWRCDINNSTNSGNMAPKPIFPMEAVRDLNQTSYQGVPFNVSYIPNRLAFMGQWYPNTVYGCGYGVAQVPQTPIQQFIDVNGNILFIDSTVLGLNINSPGYQNTPIVLPANSPYGTSGSTQPAAPPNSPAGTRIQDGTVIWTVADPDGVAIRISPLPAYSGLAWLITPVYQREAPILTRLQDTISPIPPDLNYLFRRGFKAMLYEHAGSKLAMESYAKWEEDLITAVRAADRQLEDYGLYPSNSIMGGGPFSVTAGNIGPGWPYGPGNL
jgi:hypothetical protein